jgi:hypothetical protein
LRVRWLPSIPTGITRSDAASSPNLDLDLDIDGIDDLRVDADVTVIDSGISPHADLNRVKHVDCAIGALQIGSMLVNTGNFNWTDDPGDGIKEPLLDLSSTTVYNP